MKKKIWKLFAFVLAVFMTTATTSTAIIYAEEETTTQASPDILLFRDYEDYDGGAGFLNVSYEYGSLKNGTGTGFAVAFTSVNGAGGKGFRTNIIKDTKNKYVGEGRWDKTLTTPITSGKVYIAYDVQKKPDDLRTTEATKDDGEPIFDNAFKPSNGIRFNVDMKYEKNETNVNFEFFPAAFKTGKDQGIVDGGFSTWIWGSTNPVMEAGRTYHVETIVDMDEYKVKRYVDGAQMNVMDISSQKDIKLIDTKDSTLTKKPFGIYKMSVLLGSGIEYFDNFTIIHYPTGTSDNGTIDVSAAGYDKTDNSLIINLKRNVSSTATIDGMSYTHTASYGESVAAESLKNIVTVKDNTGATCNVTSVSNGDISGEYKIKLDGELSEESTYTVTLNNPVNTDGTVKSILGTPVSTTANTASIYISPEVYFDYDFENTSLKNADLDYSPADNNLKAGGFDNIETKSDERYGKYISVADTKSTKIYFKEYPEPINSGVKNISFDYMFNKTTGDSGEIKHPDTQDYINFYNNAGVRKFLFYADYTKENPKFMLGKDNVAGNGDSKKTITVEDNKLYHVDIVMDYDNLKYTGYVNGEKFNESTLSASGNEIKKMLLNQFQTAFFDNYRLSDMNDTSFKIDSVTKRNGLLYEIKLSEGLSSTSATAITNETLGFKNVSTGESVAVKSVEAIGRRVIIDLNEALDPSSDYEITLPEDLTNVIGKTLGDTKAVIEGKSLKVEKIEMKTEKGEVITDATQISDGETIKLCVTYKNTSDDPKPFKLLGAAFNAYGLCDSIMEEVKAEPNMTESATMEYEFKLKNGAQVTRLGCYAWDKMDTIKPLIKNASANVNSAE